MTRKQRGHSPAAAGQPEAPAGDRRGLRSLGADFKMLAESLRAERTDSGTSELFHLSSLLDSVTTAVISLDGEGRIRVFNAAGEKLFGVPRAMVVGRRMNEIGRMMGFDDHGRKALWERLSDAVWAAGAALDLEYDLVESNGRRRVISYSVYPLGRMAWSVDNGVVIMLDDVTRKKEMEEQISDARKRLLAVFEGITDGIQVVDSEFRVTAVNKSMTRHAGRAVRPGERCRDACPFGIPADRICPAEETFRDNASASLVARIERPGEEPQVIELSTFPLLDRGNRAVQVVEYVKDVTERVRMAERLDQSRRLAELGEMAARVAHEVRNPLNAITGAAHFLETEYAGDETLRKFTSLIKRQAVRVNQVASDLLYMSKPLPAVLKSVNLHAVLDLALDSLCEQTRGLRVEQERAAELPPLQADELQLEQALHNVLQNAVEAMDSGGMLRISSCVTNGNDHIELRVRDSGHGIPEQNRDRVFQSFFTTKTKGTGLGLTIVQRVVRNHGGEVVMEHPEDGGTVVCLRFPVGRKENGRGQA
jgi:PAS domain S-box-containing protein